MEGIKLESRKDTINKAYKAFEDRVRAEEQLTVDPKFPGLNGNVGRMFYPAFEPQMPEHKDKKRSLLAEKNVIEEKISQLKRDIEVINSKITAIQHIPIFFDIPNFDEILAQIFPLLDVVSKIKIGGQEYSIHELWNIVETVKDHCRHPDFNPADEKALNDYLGSLNVTNEKISSFSALGFRECMLKCIEGDHPAVDFNPVDSQA